MIVISFYLPAEVGIAVGGENLKYAAVKGEDGHVKGSAAQVKNENIFFALVRNCVQPVGHRCRCWFVDDSKK
jgi:hypothetical protein